MGLGSARPSWEAVRPAALMALAAVPLGLAAGARPGLAVAGAVGLGFVALIVADLTVGVCLFALLSFLDELPSPGGSVASLGKVAGLLLAISWLATVTSRSRREREFASSHPAMTAVLVAFVAWSALSVAWSEAAGPAQTATFRYALVAILFLIVFSAVRRLEHVVWLVATLVAGASLSAVYGIVSDAGPAAAADAGRLSGTIGDPNELAAVLVAGAVLAVALAAARPRGSATRLLAGAATVVCVSGVVLSLSRGGLVALGVALLAAVAVAGRWRPLAGAVVVAVAVAVVGYFALYAPLSATQRVTRTQGGTGRADIWTVGWRMVGARPLTGVGAGNFTSASVHYLLEPGVIRRSDLIVDTPKVAHNTYLQVLAELGVPGLALFLALIGFSLASTVRAAHAFARTGDRRMEALARLVFVALAGILAADVFISKEWGKQLWLLLALGPSLQRIARLPSASPRPLSPAGG